MSLETPRDLFIDELADMMSAEHIIRNGLKTMASEAENAELKKAFSDHLKQTDGHIDRLTKAFKAMDHKPEEKTCAAAEGLAKELEELLDEKPQGLVKDLGLMICAAKTEHYEISSYTVLAQFATALGESDVTSLLREILAEEEEADKLVRSIQRSMNSEIKSEDADA